MYLKKTAGILLRVIDSIAAKTMCPPSSTGSGSRFMNASENVMRMMKENPPRYPSLFSLYQSAWMMPSGPLMWRTPTWVCETSRGVPVTTLLARLVSGAKRSPSVRVVVPMISENCVHGSMCWRLLVRPVLRTTPIR